MMSIQSTNPATNKVNKIVEEMPETVVEPSIAKSVVTFYVTLPYDAEPQEKIELKMWVRQQLKILSTVSLCF